nr:GNAT family N-acetyltransferase [Pseudoruegeria sp. HB172150]
MTPTLRPARADELPALSDHCLRSKSHWGYDADFLEACRAELTLTPETLARGPLMVAEIDGRLAATVQLIPDGDGAELAKLFVDPDFIGTGLGKYLFRWAEDEARRRNIRRLHFSAEPLAVPFYRAMGAQVTGEEPSGSIPGRMLPVLEKTLD